MYVHREEANKRCHCDYTFKEHTPKAQKLRSDDPDLKWQYKEHSRQDMTNAFGDIEFVGYGGNTGKVIIEL